LATDRRSAGLLQVNVEAVEDRPGGLEQSIVVDRLRDPFELLARPGVEQRATTPSASWRAPSRRSCRQISIRGVDGSRGRR
jgi:hypothetical protein